MKRQIAKLVIAFFLVSILTGCSSPKSTVTSIELSEREEAIGQMFNGNVGILKFDFRDDVQGAVMYTEVWEKDKCVERTVWSCGGTGDEELYLSWEVDSYKEQSILRMRSVTDDAASVYPVITKTIPGDKPEGMAWAWSFLDGVTGSSKELEPGKTYLLTMQAFDTEPTVTGNSSVSQVHGTQKAEERHLNQDDYTILLLMDTFATEEEALAAADRMEEAV